MEAIHLLSSWCHSVVGIYSIVSWSHVYSVKPQIAQLDCPKWWLLSTTATHFILQCHLLIFSFDCLLEEVSSALCQIDHGFLGTLSPLWLFAPPFFTWFTTMTKLILAWELAFTLLAYSFHDLVITCLLKLGLIFYLICYFFNGHLLILFSFLNAPISILFDLWVTDLFFCNISECFSFPSDGKTTIAFLTLLCSLGLDSKACCGLILLW